MSRFLFILFAIVLFPVILILGMIVGTIEVYRTLYTSFLTAFHNEDIV